MAMWRAFFAGKKKMAATVDSDGQAGGLDSEMAALCAQVYAGRPERLSERLSGKGAAAFVGRSQDGSRMTVVFRGSVGAADLAADRLPGGPGRAWARASANMQDAVDEALGVLLAGGRVVVAGHSLGGFMATEFASELARRAGPSRAKALSGLSVGAIDPIGFSQGYLSLLSSGAMSGADVLHVVSEGSVAGAGRARVRLGGKAGALADRFGVREALEAGNGLSSPMEAAGLPGVRTAVVRGAGDALSSHNAQALADAVAGWAGAAAAPSKMSGGRLVDWRTGRDGGERVMGRDFSR